MQQRHLVGLLIIGVLSLSVPPDLVGQVLVHEQLPQFQPGSGWLVNTDRSTLLKFSLNSATEISTVIWWGGYSATTPAVDSFTVSLLADNAGFPGYSFASYSPGAGSQSRVLTGKWLRAPYGDRGGIPEYIYSLTLPTPLAVPAGTYWLQIRNAAIVSINEYFYWEMSSVAGAMSECWEGGSCQVWPETTQAAFRLEAPLRPEFSSLGLQNLSPWTL